MSDKEYPLPSKIVLEDRWFLTHGVWNGHPIIVRGRPDLEVLAGHPCYATRLVITWSYPDDGELGMPTREVQLEMENFENLCLEAVERDHQAIVVAVVTTNGVREWICYSQNVQATVRRLNDALSNQEQKPISLSAYPDPEWEEYLGIQENFGGNGEDGVDETENHNEAGLG